MTDWTTPGVFPVAAGVFRIPLPLPNDGLRAVNVYAITDGDGVVLVDSGWALPDSLEQLERGLAELGAGLADISRILVTHVHRDHYTQALTIRDKVGTTVALGADEQPTLDVILAGPGAVFDGHRAQLLRHGADELAELIGRAGAEPSSWAYPDTWLQPAEQVVLGSRTLDSLPTPGHTRGHVVFVDAAADLLFAGDHVLPSITPSIAVEPNPSRLALRDYLDSLRLVRSMPDRMLLPAHGAVAPSAHDRIDELLTHHDTRLADTLAAVHEGATVYDVARVLRWTRRGRAFSELDPYNQMLAVGESAAHLDLLVHTGRLHCREVDGVSRYSGS